MYIKIHRSYRNVVAICDAEILGMKFEEGKRLLDVRESFYNGEKVDEVRALEIVKMQAKDDSTFNIAGKMAVGMALKAGLISEDNIGKVQGVPFALVLV